MHCDKMMDEEMEDVFQQRLQCFEIDIDYEFDASRFFDFMRPESLSETRAAELWFENAGSYPPSPYIAKLNLREDAITGNLSAFTNPKDVEHSNSVTTHSKIDIRMGFSVLNENEGWIFHDQIAKYIPIAKTKSVIKAPFSSGSTLMKPTASQLAKQNRPREIKGPRQFVQRLQKSMVKKNERNLENPSRNESQASKRQKLENGQLCKVFDINQHTDLIHKVPKKDGPVKCNTEQCRLKLTIPRGPALETSQRVRRMRSKSTTDAGEQVLSAAPIFKACPLNKKILEAPSMPVPQKSIPHMPEFQEFDLKTSKRAMHHLSTTSSLLCCKNSDNVAHKHKNSSIIQLDATDTKRLRQKDLISSQPQKPNLIDDLKREECETISKFKARPLNKKIFLSKGDIGVFRTSKKENTVPREFNFMTEKRFQQNLPIELFNKLSLTAEPKQNTVSQSTASQSTQRPMKNTKENMNDSLQQAHPITQESTKKLERLRVKQSQYESEGMMTEISSRLNMCSIP